MTSDAPVRDLDAIHANRDRIRDQHLRPAPDRPASSARGLHHTALISSDVERTVRFYQDVLEFPLTELIENRDYPGSSHFFFDIGNGNLLAFFDFPGLDVGPYAEVLGGLHHVAISVEPERWRHLVGKLDAAGVEHVIHSEVSVYFRDPDGARIELIADPLGEMYGTSGALKAGAPDVAASRGALMSGPVTVADTSDAPTPDVATATRRWRSPTRAPPRSAA